MNLTTVLYSGLSGEANIITAKKEKVFTILKYCLIDNYKAEIKIFTGNLLIYNILSKKIIRSSEA